MKLPRVDQPQRLDGLYVYDFGEWVAVGYTAEEIEVLLEDKQYGGGKVYRIHRARPNGEFELRGVAPERFHLESGMFFYRAGLDRAREDFEALRHAAEAVPPPCRAYVQLADTGVEGAGRYVTALVFPAEHEEAVGRWLLEVDYRGGDLVEGGISHVTNYYEQEKNILERVQLWGRSAFSSRPPEEVLASVRCAVQR